MVRMAGRVSMSSRLAAEAAAAELSWLKRWVVLGIVCVGVFMNTLDTGITDVLNPVFTAQFHLNLYQEYWIELSYAIPLIGMLLPAGHLGDRFGRKNVFLAGMILFGGGSGLQTLSLAAGFIIFGAAFFWVSTHVKDPTIDLSLYKSRNFSVAVAAAFISFLALTPVNHLLPFYMEHVQGLHVSETGLVFITTTLAIAVTQPFSGRWADRIGSRPVASLGLLLEGLGLLTLAFIPLHMNPDWLVPELVVIGVGVGLFRSPNHRALFGAVPRDKMGQAGGYQHLPRQLGESIGETGVVTMFTAIVLASAALGGIHAVGPASQAVAAPLQPTPV